MSTVNTGYKRSLYITFNKYVNGVLQPTYPHYYNGLLEFSHNGVTYPALDGDAFSLLSGTDYNTRLAAFKAYVAITEGVPSIDPYVVAGFEPIKYDPIACPKVDNPT